MFNLFADIINSSANLAGNTVKGAANLTGGVIGGATNLAVDTTKNICDLFTGNEEDDDNYC